MRHNSQWIGVFPVIACLCCCAAASPPGATTTTTAPSGFRREYAIEWLHGFQEGLAEVEVDGKWGFIDHSGQIVIKPTFDQAMGVAEGLAWARHGAISNEPKAATLGAVGNWSFVDTKGNVVTNPDVSVASLLSEGLAAVRVGGRNAFSGPPRWGYVRSDGSIAITPRFDWAFPFAEGLALVQLGRRRGYVDHQGQMVIQPRFRYAGRFREGRAVAKDKEGVKLIDPAGRDIAKLDCDDALTYDYSERLRAVAKNGKWGFIDQTGALVIATRFERVNEFSEGLAAFIQENRVGFIDRSGHVVIESRFELSTYLDAQYHAPNCRRPYAFPKAWQPC